MVFDMFDLLLGQNSLSFWDVVAAIRRGKRWETVAGMRLVVSVVGSQITTTKASEASSGTSYSVYSVYWLYADLLYCCIQILILLRFATFSKLYWPIVE